MRTRRSAPNHSVFTGVLVAAAALVALAPVVASTASAHAGRNDVDPAGGPPGVPVAAVTPEATGTPPDPETAVDLLTRLDRELGDRTSGTYVDAAGWPVVTVTDGATAEVARQAGAVPKLVTRTRSQLKTTMATLNSETAVPGTSWSVDPASNQVVIEFDSSVTEAGMQQVRAAAAALGDAVRLKPMDGRLSTTVSGGDAIFGQGGRCSLGFAVRVGGADAFLTAGHCGNVVRTWFADSRGQVPLGVTVRSSFPGNDFALVQVTSPDVRLNGTVRRRDIRDAGTPVIGQQVARRGSVTGTHTGQVTALNATVNYPEGTVTGLIRTTVCAEPGDSGGPLFSGSTALGLTSGGSGDCQRGGVTFFQPVTEPLEVFGAEVR